MFFLKKLLSSLFLPPGFFILAFLLISFFERKKKLTYYFSMTCALCLYLLSIEPVKDALFTPLENKFPVPGRVEGDALVVLGGGSYKTGILKEDSMKRLLTALTLHKKTGLPIILSGGAGSLPDAEVMKSILLDLGVDKRNIITEVQSRDTKENAMYVKKVCQERNYRKIILITSAYHMPRAVLLFEREGISVLPYPTDFKRDLMYNLYSLLPKMSVLSDSVKALREYLALLFLKLPIQLL
ncbi:MAG: YdcF family protein [Hydrogenobacter sp.]